jgi:hypothetical protein
MAAARMTCRVLLLALVSAGFGSFAFPVGAEGHGEPQENSEVAPAPDVEEAPTASEPRDRMTIPSAGSANSGTPGLDALLRLPTGYDGQPLPQSVAGAGEKEWRRRFRVTRTALDESRKALEATKIELDGAAQQSGGTQWSVAPPGGGGGGGSNQSTSPLSFKLRQALKTNRIELEAAERNLRELEIEANLAGVPKSWRGTSEDAGATPSEVGQLLD